MTFVSSSTGGYHNNRQYSTRAQEIDIKIRGGKDKRIREGKYKNKYKNKKESEKGAIYAFTGDCCSHAHSTVTRPCSISARSAKTLVVVSMSVTLHPTPNNTIIKSGPKNDD